MREKNRGRIMETHELFTIQTEEGERGGSSGQETHIEKMKLSVPGGGPGGGRWRSLPRGLTPGVTEEENQLVPQAAEPGTPGRREVALES